MTLYSRRVCIITTRIHKTIFFKERSCNSCPICTNTNLHRSSKQMSSKHFSFIPSSITLQRYGIDLSSKPIKITNSNWVSMLNKSTSMGKLQEFSLELWKSARNAACFCNTRSINTITYENLNTKWTTERKKKNKKKLKIRKEKKVP